MSVITTGKTFANGEQLSADKLNLMLDNATFSNDAVDLTSTFVDSNGAIVVKDGGVTTSKLADTSVTTAKISDSNVTKAKIEDVDDMKVLGNTSGSATSPQEVSVLDEDDMVSDSATALATQQSIKAYVDSAPNFTPSTYAGGESVTFPNGLIMKWGIASLSAAGGTITFATPFPNAVINIQGGAVGADYTANLGVTSFSTTQIACNPASNAVYHWQAIGY
jgi:hypothetical protein